MCSFALEISHRARLFFMFWSKISKNAHPDVSYRNLIARPYRKPKPLRQRDETKRFSNSNISPHPTFHRPGDATSGPTRLHRDETPETQDGQTWRRVTCGSAYSISTFDITRIGDPYSYSVPKRAPYQSPPEQSYLVYLRKEVRINQGATYLHSLLGLIPPCLR